MKLIFIFVLCLLIYFVFRIIFIETFMRKRGWMSELYNNGDWSPSRYFIRNQESILESSIHKMLIYQIIKYFK